MLRITMCAFLVLSLFAVQAQKKEQGFDFFFKPTQGAARYYVITQKKDSLWHREAYYLPERGMAMEGFYKDEDCQTPHGTVSWYHPNKNLKSKGSYVNGKREGMHLNFDGEGHMTDSANYAGDRLKGIKLAWTSDGIQIDSMNFDGAGNGAQVSWYKDGTLEMAGYWEADTLRKGRWKYYHANGQLKATEEYAGGKRTAIACYDEKGQLLKDCEMVEAQFPGGDGAWGRYIGGKLKAEVPVNKGAPVGQYMVVVQFIVNTDGTIENIESLTQFGYGMEQEVERVIRHSPRWKPAKQYGKLVRAYRRQPITFEVSQQ